MQEAVPEAVLLGISIAGPGAIPSFKRVTGAEFPLLFDPNYHLDDPAERMECATTARVDETGRVIYVSQPEAKASDMLVVWRRHRTFAARSGGP
jgi:hypothetical protein